MMEPTVVKLIDTSLTLLTNTVNSPLVEDIYIYEIIKFNAHYKTNLFIQLVVQMNDSKAVYLDCSATMPNCKSRKCCSLGIFRQCGSPLKLYIIIHRSHQYIFTNPIESVRKSIKSGNMGITKCKHCINY